MSRDGHEIGNDSLDSKFSGETKWSTDDPDPERRSSNDENIFRNTSAAELRLDSNGLPLVPQPSKFKDDPLVSFPTTSNKTPHI